MQGNCSLAKAGIAASPHVIPLLRISLLGCVVTGGATVLVQFQYHELRAAARTSSRKPWARTPTARSSCCARRRATWNRASVLASDGEGARRIHRRRARHVSASCV